MKRKNLIFSIMSGLLLGLSFPPYPFPLLAFIGFVPILFLFETDDNIRTKFRYLYLTFFLYHGLTNWWISSWRSETDPYLMASGIAVWIAHPFVFLLPFVFYFFIKKRFGSNTALWTFPVAWTSFEWLHSLGEFSYPWLTIGNTQIYNRYWIQFIDITGVWGASFLIVLANIILLKMVLNFRVLGIRFNTKKFISRSQKLAVSIALIVILPNIYGLFRVLDFNHTDLLVDNKTINVGIIQPNINPWRKWETNGLDQIAMHQRTQDSLTNAVPGIDLCIWSETAIPSISLAINQAHFYPFLQEWLDKSGTSLMTGFSEYYVYPNKSKAPITARPWVMDSTERWEPFNAALMLNPKPNEGLNPQIYRKSRLTPFAERLPYADKVSFAQAWFKWGVGISSWGIGREQFTLKMQNHNKTANVGSVICIESIYPEFVSGFVRKGANVLSVITNDAWYDYTIGPEQHFQIAAMRAIETRRYVARCANTGVSGFITPIGTSLVRAEQYKTTAISAILPLLEEKTIYVKYGDWLAKALFGFSVFMIIFGVVRKYRAK